MKTFSNQPKNEGLELWRMGNYVWGIDFFRSLMARCALLVSAIVALHSDLRGWPLKTADGNTLSGQILATENLTENSPF